MTDFASEYHSVTPRNEVRKKVEQQLPEQGFILFPKSDKTEFVYGIDRNGRAILPYSILTAETEDGQFVVDSNMRYEDVARLKNVRVITDEELPYFRRIMEIETVDIVDIHIPAGETQSEIVPLAIEDPQVSQLLKTADSCVATQNAIMIGPRVGFELMNAEETNPYPIRYVPVGGIVQLTGSVFLSSEYSDGVVHLRFHKPHLNMDPNATQQDSDLSDRLVYAIESKRFFLQQQDVETSTPTEDYLLVEGQVTDRDLRGLRKTDAQIKKALTDSLIQSGATSAELNEILKEFENWKKVPQMIRDADTVFFPRAGGLGDAYYQLLMAMSIARAHPQTSFYIHRTPTEATLYPETFRDIPNLHILFESQNALKHLHDQRKLGQKVAIVNLDRSHDLSESVMEESQQVERDRQQGARTSKESQNRATAAWYKKMLSKVFASDEIKGRTISYIGNSSTSLRNKLMFRWAYAVTQLKEALNLDLQQHAKQDPLIAHTELSQLSSHQIVDIASKLENLFKVSSLHLLHDCPLKIVQETGPRKENHSSKRYDVVLVYDAKSQGTNKLLSPEQWNTLITELQRRHPGISIGIVKGLTNPETLNGVFPEHPEIDLISGELGDVVETCVNAKVVVTVDTGVGHFINGYVKHERQTDSTRPRPKIVSVMGTSALFSIPFYRLDEAKTIAVKDFVCNLESSVLIDQVDAAVRAA